MATSDSSLLLIGATQGVGDSFLDALMANGHPQRLVIHAVSRMPPSQTLIEKDGVSIHWHAYDLRQRGSDLVADWVVSAGPVDLVLRQLKHWGETHQPRVVWALSSASPDFKLNSSDLAECEQMQVIERAEKELIGYCQAHRIDLQLFKTTMLYGRCDRNINRLAGLMERLKWFPVSGNGQRAPVHVDDVAKLIVDQLQQAHESDGSIKGGVWRLQGGECLGYFEMLQRIARARGLKVRLLPVPANLMQWLLQVLHVTGRLRDVKVTMIARQAIDLTIDDADARKSLGWAPRPFLPFT